MEFMKNQLGAWQVGGDSKSGNVRFRILFPKGFDPHIQSIRVSGDFQSQVSKFPDWDFANGFPLAAADTEDGILWSWQTPKPLKAGFYEYKYLMTFTDGSQRRVSDPCTRYGGTENENAGIVVGGSSPQDTPLEPIVGGLKPPRDLVVYELMLDDFTNGYLDDRSPMEAVVDKLDYIQGLGFNAILFMPWTSWKDTGFDWGYEPFQYYAVEYRYATTFTAPWEKLSNLKSLINECHCRGLHVIMDGVFNHVSTDFPYKAMYLDPEDCPFTAEPFGGSFPGLQDLDFNNSCTNDFILDVCRYWIDNFSIDGIRFDNSVNYYVPGNAKGLPKLLNGIQNYTEATKKRDFSLTLEHIDMSAAQVTNSTAATGFWDNSLFSLAFGSLWNGRIDPGLLNGLNNQRWLDDPRKAPMLYLSNHDHSQACWQAGAHDLSGGAKWYKVQPYVIALYTSTAVPLVPNGQEIGEDHWIPEDDGGTGRRVASRPVQWKLAGDAYGSPLLELHRRMGQIRNQYPGLRSPNFYPQQWDTWQTRFNPQGYGLDMEKQVAIYHRWGNDEKGALQRFIIVLNFSDSPQLVSVPFPDNGVWVDLLSGYNGSWAPTVSDYTLNYTVGSNWGSVFFKAG
jgi:glycosidase